MEHRKFKFSINSVNFISVVWFLFGLQLVAANVTKHSIYYQIAGGLFILSSFFLLLKHVKIKWERQYLFDIAITNKYYVVTLCFILYNFLLILFGNVHDVSNSMRMFKTISINFVLFLLIFNFLLLANNKEKLLKIYIHSMAIANILILFIFRESVLAGERLAFSWGDRISSYDLFGIEVITSGPNGIAYYSGIAFILTTYLLFKQKNNLKYLYLFYDFLFIITILTTGSRKGLLIVAIGMFFLPLLITKRSKKFKLLYGISGTVTVAILLLLTQIVPFLYDMIGARIQRILLSIFTGEVIDISMDTRISLMDSAINLISANPLFGYGLDAFRVMGPWGIITDNNYLDILVSSGIIGLIIYYTYAGFVIYDFISINGKSSLVKIFFMIFCINIFLDFFSVSYFERNFGFVNVMLFYILTAEKGRNRIEYKKIP